MVPGRCGSALGRASENADAKGPAGEGQASEMALGGVSPAGARASGAMPGQACRRRDLRCRCPGRDRAASPVIRLKPPATDRSLTHRSRAAACRAARGSDLAEGGLHREGAATLRAPVNTSPSVGSRRGVENMAVHRRRGVGACREAASGGGGVPGGARRRCCTARPELSLHGVVLRQAAVDPRQGGAALKGPIDLHTMEVTAHGTYSGLTRSGAADR